MVVVGKDGASSFQALQNALSVGDDKSVTYFLFDILYCDSDDLTHLSLIERKRVLRSLLGEENQPLLRYSDHVHGHGLVMFENACGMHLEGIVAKRISGVYRAGRSRDWLKIKCLQRQEFVVGGFTNPSGARQGFGALLLGAYTEPGILQYVGRVGTGFTERVLDDLQGRLKALTIEVSPFCGRVPGRALHWVQPELVAEVAFANWTGEGVLRHASFQGLREDKSAQEVVLDRPIALAVADNAKSTTPTIAPRYDVRLSNTRKIFYPDAALTKGDVAGYYEAASEYILPTVSGRLLTLVRCPNGQHGNCYFWVCTLLP